MATDTVVEVASMSLETQLVAQIDGMEVQEVEAAEEAACCYKCGLAVSLDSMASTKSDRHKVVCKTCTTFEAGRQRRKGCLGRVSDPELH